MDFKVEWKGREFHQLLLASVRPKKFCFPTLFYNLILEEQKILENVGTFKRFEMA